MDSISECSPQVQGIKSPLFIVAPTALVVVQFSGRFFMRVLICLSVLLSAWVRCVYVIWPCGVVVGSSRSGRGWWLVSVLSVVSRVC